MKLPNSSYHPQSNFSIWRTGFRRDNMSQLTYESGKRSDSTPAFSNTWDSRPGQRPSPPHPLVDVRREESCVKIGEGFISPEKCVISVGKYFPLERNWRYVLEAFIESASCATEKGKWGENEWETIAPSQCPLFLSIFSFCVVITLNWNILLHKS